MAGRNWNKDRATKRIDAKIDALKDIEIKEYVRDTNLANLSSTVAYRVDGVHLYADILNMKDMLAVTEIEGETCHKRTLRFLNLHYRAAYRIIARVDAILVDFHNQRLHSVVTKPYDGEAKRVHRAVATGQLIIDVLAQTGEDADHPAAKVRIGIDTGKALAVNNGRRGHREPLFLGEPANHAAKRAGGGTATGIYLTNTARKAIGLAEVTSVDSSPLTTAEIEKSQNEAKLEVTAADIVKEWQEDLKSNPIGAFEFSGHTPPYATLDIESLSAKNSRRQEAATVYGDLDGFTKYVGANIVTDDGAKHVVRTLHVLRSELDAVLHEDFQGHKVRFIGDCIHGLLVEGTAQTTDTQETISNMTLCAGAMRSSFNVALKRLKEKGTDASSLGLAIGFEFGPMNVTRLGMKGDLIRCSVSRGVLAAESEQSRCTGRQTAIGKVAYAKSTHGVHALFGDARVRTDLDYETAVNEMAGKDDKSARASKAMAASSLLQPPSAAAQPFSFPNRPTGPAKPDGFA
ncbi:transcriptional regulator [Bradyrhizobium sp. CCBAU 53421]|uniref:transcriptional regulator n=1 Tax=Bradyrhizobium sp. CCBAU 53421 TaxID=1325120 RepID=UPI00188D7ADE|nr:transcriptional regulator [Bradyrhizobium sp. CCBAU 53421]QOZ36362.1 transcriptional regulator [Bradyrhizobium sp. CCBAU 53421]